MTREPSSKSAKILYRPLGLTESPAGGITARKRQFNTSLEACHPRATETKRPKYGSPSTDFATSQSRRHPRRDLRHGQGMINRGGATVSTLDGEWPGERIYHCSTMTGAQGAITRQRPTWIRSRRPEPPRRLATELEKQEHRIDIANWALDRCPQWMDPDDRREQATDSCATLGPRAH